MSNRNRQNSNRNSNRSFSNNRSNNRGRYGGNRSSYGQRRPAEMHTVTCSKCGKETEVPFKPDGSRPVYCKECYQQNKPRRY